MDLFLLQGFSYWVTLPEGPHGMVEAAARKRRCPAPTRALAGARASGCGTNLTRVGHCQAKSCPGQPGASLAKPLTAGKNREQGAGVAPTLLQPQMLPSASFWEGLSSPKHTACSSRAPGCRISMISTTTGRSARGKNTGMSDAAAWVIPVPQGNSPRGKSARRDPHP